MADVPEGTELLGDPAFPTLVCDDVVMLPGVPKFLRYQFDRFAAAWAASRSTWPASTSRWSRTRLPPALTAVAAAHPGVELGSYPRFDDADHLVKLTVESRDRPTVVAALEALLAALPAGAVVRVTVRESPGPAAPPGRR